MSKLIMGLSDENGPLGCLGRHENDYAMIVNITSAAIQFERETDRAGNYFRVAGTDTYLSVTKSPNYLAFYPASGKTSFQLNNIYLTSDWNNGQKLSFHDDYDHYLYARNDYTVLKVNFLEAPVPRSGGLSSWMTDLKDEDSIASLSIPGTHDSAALYDKLSFGQTKCQTLTIPQQLAAGIRFLDLRVRESGMIHHGIVDQNTDLETVVNEIITFLDAHKTEFVLVYITWDDPEHKNLSQQMEFTDRFINSWMGEEKNWFRDKKPPKGRWFLEERIPKVSEVRGKMVLLRAYDEKDSEDGKKHFVFGWQDPSVLAEPVISVLANDDKLPHGAPINKGESIYDDESIYKGPLGLPCNVFNRFELGENDYFVSSSFYKITGAAKLGHIKSMLEAKHDQKKIVMNWTNSTGFGGPWKTSGVNTDVWRYVRGKRPGRQFFGVMPMDFCDQYRELVEFIIDNNFATDELPAEWSGP